MEKVALKTSLHEIPYTLGSGTPSQIRRQIVFLVSISLKAAYRYKLIFELAHRRTI